MAIRPATSRSVVSRKPASGATRRSPITRPRDTPSIAPQRQEEAAHTRATLVEALEDAVASLAQASSLTHQDIDSLRAQQRLHGERWLALSDHYPPDDDIQARYAAAQAACQRVNDAWDRATTHAKALEDALRDDHAAIDDCLARIDWPNDLPPTPLIQEARRLRQAETADGDAPVDLAALQKSSTHSNITSTAAP